jgi:hypothetical protein
LVTLKSQLTRTTVHKLCLVSQWVQITVSNHHASTIHVPAQCSCTCMCRHPVCNATYQEEFYEAIGISCTMPEFTCIWGYLRQMWFKHNIDHYFSLGWWSSCGIKVWTHSIPDLQGNEEDKESFSETGK